MTMPKIRPRKRPKPTSPLQAGLFDGLDALTAQELRLVEVPSVPAPRAGGCDDDAALRRELTRHMKGSAFGRDTIAQHMSELTGRVITRAQLDAWTGPSRDNRFPVAYLRAWLWACGTDAGAFLSWLAEGLGYVVLSAREAQWARIGQLMVLSSRAKQEMGRLVQSYLRHREGGAS